MIDLVIIGGGPSALTAGIYAARDGLSVQIFEKDVIGGIVTTSESIENYPGFEEGISGLELAKKMRSQAQRFGVKIDYGEVSDIQDLGESVKMKVDGVEFYAKKALIATGNSYNTLKIHREDDFLGRGIYFCATCDGPVFAGKEVVVVGGGNSAIQEALFLSKFSKVKILVRSVISAEEILRKRLDEAINEGKIEIFLNSEVSDLLIEKTEFGERIHGVKVRQDIGGKVNNFEIEAAAVFEFIGLKPNTKFIENSQVELNQRGEIIVNDKLQTSSKNIFASGDVIENAEKQLVVAAATGARAAIEISRSLHS